jgi:uroporphyrinogen decarboxylase
MLTEQEYDLWAQPFHRRILAGATGAPRILFVKECPYLHKQVETGADIISLGKRNDLKEARDKYPHLVFQGNVDEEKLIRFKTLEMVLQNFEDNVNNITASKR